MVQFPTPTPELAKGNTHWDVVPVAQTPDGMAAIMRPWVKPGGEIQDHLFSHSQLKQKCYATTSPEHIYFIDLHM